MAVTDSPHTVLTSARHAIVLTPDQRAIRCEVARWALATGHPLHLDAITVILAVKSFESSIDGRPFNRWSAQSTLTFIWGSVREWCGARSIEVPPQLAESLWTWFDFLGRHRQFASGSSTLGALRDVLVDTGGLTRSGRAPVTRSGRAPVTRAR